MRPQSSWFHYVLQVSADVGFHNSEIQTPNIDRLSREGTRLERFYSSSRFDHALAGQHPDTVKDLVGRMEKWRALHPAGGVRISDGPPAGYRAPKLWAEAPQIR
jgi:hypothetical protein